MMRRWFHILCLLWLGGSTGAFAQTSCGFFDPKIRFADGSSACISAFPLLNRPGLISSTEFGDVHSVARTHASSYALAVTAKPNQCPFVQFTAWNWSGHDAATALPGCEKRLTEALSQYPHLKDCRCDVLIDSGRTTLSRGQFEERLKQIEHFLAEGVPAEESKRKLAERQQRENEAQRLALAQRQAAEEKRIADERQKEKERVDNELKLSKAIEAERERVAAAERLRAEERRRIEDSARLEKELAALREKLQEADRARQQASLANLADPSYFRNRVALVIGNSAYAGTWALRNPSNDAKAIAERLNGLGFDVTLVTDLKVNEIGRTLGGISQKLKPGGAFVFYYAGHGIQLRNENYFPSVDADIKTQFDLPTQSLALQQVLNLADEVKSELRIIMLDACRNNPWMVASRSLAGGLAKIEAPKGTLISYATRPGSVAEDGVGQNGLYTGMLLKHLLTPNLPIESMFKRVARDVEEASRGQQEPWHEGNLRGEFAFVVNR